MKKTFELDVVVVGGGVAGLWTLNQLRRAGYQAVLLEHHSLGGGQTIASQGIIHGGVKYALKGLLNTSANSIAEMPQFWQKCLSGEGELDLRSVEVLSDAQYLWSTGTLTAKLSQFFASKALHSRVTRLKTSDEYPVLFQNTAFKGLIYKLDECVLNIASLIPALSAPVMDSIIKVRKNDVIFKLDDHGRIIELRTYTDDDLELIFKAKTFVLTAGEGMGSLLKGIPRSPQMQRRPLQMVMAKLENSRPLYAHCMDGHANPRVTITSHITQKGDSIWYIGGQLAEEGYDRTQDEQIILAQQEIKALFPWLNFSRSEWASFYIDRAEEAQPNQQRPSYITVSDRDNIIFAWPTKLTLSPLLADEILQRLIEKGITPTENQVVSFDQFPKPPYAKPIWDQLFT